MKRKLLALSVSAAVVALQSTSVFAQASNEVEQIVVTGTRTENLIQNVPNTTEMFTANDIQEMGATTIKDVLTRATNVQLSAQKGGVNIRGLGADYTVILVNGRKPGGLENIKDFQSMIMTTLNVNNIERIEVLRGQAGAMYGANALGGVINIITKQSEEESTTFSGTVGNSTTKVAVVHDFGVNGKWDGTFAANFSDIDGIEETSFSSQGDTFKNGDGYLGNANATIGYQINDENRVRAELGYIVDRNKEYYDNVVSRDTDRTLLTSAFILDGFTEANSYSTGIAYNRTANMKDEHEDVFEDIVFDAQNAWTINDTNTILMGGEYVTDSASTEDTEKTLSRYAVYLQDEMTLLNDRLFLVPSVRFDDHETFGGKTTFQLGTTWEFVTDHRLKMNIGNGYKAPTLMQLYGVEATGIGDINGNPDLKPEESDNLEVRYEYRGDRLGYALGWYSNDITDYISRKEIGTDQHLRINIGEVEIQGVEAELNYHLTDALSVTATYNQIDAESIDATGKRTQLAYTAERIYGLDMAYINYEHDFTVNIWGNYNSNFNTGKSIFDYYNANVSAKKQINDVYSVSLGAYNLLQSERDSINDSALEPMEWRLTLDMKI